MAQDQEVVKILVVGDSGTGKTSIIKRYAPPFSQDPDLVVIDEPVLDTPVCFSSKYIAMFFFQVYFAVSHILLFSDFLFFRPG